MRAKDTGESRERLAIVGEIAAEIAHELRNILQIISASTFVAEVELGRGDAERARPHVAKVARNARIAHAVVDDLMALARGEALETADVLVADVVGAARADLPPGAARWEDDVGPGDLAVRAHGPLLTRLLHALYENAIQACTPREAVIKTRARLGDARVTVEVGDDGPGVPESIAGTVFEPLVTGRSGGTGLGLALARRIAEAHGGSIALTPSGGKGATFRVELPVAPREAGKSLG